MSINKPFTNKLEVTKPSEKTEGKIDYNLESGVTVNLSWNKFNPIKKVESDPKKVINPLSGTVIYLPGWAMDSDDKTIKQVAHDFAEENETYVITTRTEKSKPKNEAGEDIEALYEEAKAIVKFINEHNLKEVTIAGHSQGGDKSIDVVSLLQKMNPEINIKGLILIDSVGIHEQKPKELVKNFTKDMLVKTPGNLIKPKNWSAIKKGLRASNDIFKNIFKEIKKSKTEYLGRLSREVTEMSKQNKRMAEIKVPVILISGSKDPVSDPSRIVPFEDFENQAKAHEENAKRNNQQKEKDSAGDNWTPEKTSFSKSDYVQKNYFPESPNVNTVFPDKLGHHGGIFFRDLVKGATYILKRYDQKADRLNKTTNDNYLKKENQIIKKEKESKKINEIREKLGLEN